jgi:thioredoxin reductase
MFEAVIIGGGPAGLSAALVLGRCRRRVLLCDSGEYRNAPSHGLHAYLTRDGIVPADLRRLGREEIARYGVETRDGKVDDVGREPEHFTVTLDGDRLQSRTLLIATGVVDRVPRIDGIDDLYGRSVFHCPYCDGWETRDEPLAAYGNGGKGVKLALSLLRWSRDVVLCTDGPARLRAPERARLARHGVAVHEGRVARLEGDDGALHRIVFHDAEPMDRRFMFFKTGHDQRSDLAARLGCEYDDKGAVKTNSLKGTAMEGLYVLGDASQDMQLAIVAAAEGVKAGFAANEYLHHRETA